MNAEYDEAAKAFVAVLQVEKDNKAASKELQEIIVFKKQVGEAYIAAKQSNSSHCSDIENKSPQKRTECLNVLTLKVLVTTIDAQWEGMYEPVLLPPCPTIPMPDHKGFKLQ